VKNIFFIKKYDAIIEIHEFQSEVSQGSDLFLYLLYIVDLLADTNVSITIFADNTTVAIYIDIAFKDFQSNLNLIKN